MLTYYPNTGDEHAILFQSKIFSQFRLTAEVPPFPDNFIGHYLEFSNGKWFSQYPPVYSLMLVPGIFIGQPAFIVSLFSGAAILCLSHLLFRVFGKGCFWEILIFTGLVAFSPTILFHAASYYNHIGALLIYALILNSFFSYFETREPKSLLFLSLLFGLGIGIRPYTFFLLSLPIIIFLFLQKEVRGSLKSLLHLIIPFSIMLLLLLLYNFNQTDSWNDISYLNAGNNSAKLSLIHFNSISFERVFQMIGETQRWLLGLVIFSSGNLREMLPGEINLGLFLFFVCLAFLVLKTTSQEFLNYERVFFQLSAASVLLLIIGHVFYDFRGSRFGERFFFEITWMILAGLVFCIKNFQKVLNKKAYLLLCLGFYPLIFFSYLIHVPATARIYRESNIKRMDLFLKTKGSEFQNSVIHVSSVPDFDATFYTRNNPDLSGTIYMIFGRDLSQSYFHFKDRKHFFYGFDQKTKKSKILPIKL
jgi:hypothetical protein